MNMALLNGKFVDASEIDPARHRFIGTFRPPQAPRGEGYMLCTCGSILQTVQCVQEHYQRGHCDTNQYVDIEPAAKA